MTRMNPKPAKQAVKPKTKTGGNAKKPARKPAAPMHMITSRDEILKIPVGELQSSIPRIDMENVITYVAPDHVPKAGTYKGKMTWQFHMATAEGKTYKLSQSIAMAIASAWEADPLLGLQFAAYKRDNPHAK